VFIVFILNNNDIVPHTMTATNESIPMFVNFGET
jgi:hypothetical protein